jgi:hypothetical protein
MDYEDKDDRFDFEQAFCFDNLRTWWVEAVNLFYSAEVLYEFELLKTQDIFEKEKNKEFAALFSSDIVNRAFFNYRVQRMVWAYAFENLLKLLILAQIKKESPDIQTVPFKKIKSHKLNELARQAKFDLSEPESFYFGVLEKCAVWAGRYPLPTNSEQMYTARAALPTREALFERSKENYEKLIRGEIPRIESESDVIHSGINGNEYSIYQQLKSRLLEIAKEYS